jgi:hypothetical protein
LNNYQPVGNCAVWGCSVTPTSMCSDKIPAVEVTCSRESDGSDWNITGLVSVIPYTVCNNRKSDVIHCGIQHWGTASTSNRERFQSKALRMIVDAPRYVLNTVIRRDLQTPTVKEEIRRYSSQYSAHLSAHPNGLVVNLMEQPDNKTPAK